MRVEHLSTPASDNKSRLALLQVVCANGEHIGSFNIIKCSVEDPCNLSTAHVIAKLVVAMLQILKSEVSRAHVLTVPRPLLGALVGPHGGPRPGVPCAPS